MGLILNVVLFEDMLDLVEYTGEGLFMEFASRMYAGMERLTGADGKISKFNDSSEGIAKEPYELMARADGMEIAATKGTKGERDSGFVREEAGEWMLIAKCGEIGPSYQPGHAHADTWSFELWKSGEKIIGDTGCSTYIAGSIRSYERSTKAHNTVIIDGRDSSEVWASHRVGRRFDRKRHRREFQLTANGLKGIDYLSGKGEHDIEIRFHLPPGTDKNTVNINCPGDLTWEDCHFAEGWNRRKLGLCAVYSMKLSFPAEVAWKVGS